MTSASVGIVGIPDGWRSAELRNVSQIVTGKTPSTKELKYWGGDIPFVTPSDMIEGPWLNRVERHLSHQGMKHSTVVPSGSVLVTCIASIGKSCIVKSQSALNQQINACVPNAEIDSYFLYNAIQECVGHLLDLAGTTAVPIVNKSTFSTVTILVPPLDEQRRVAEVLRSVDDAIAANQTVASTLSRSLKKMRHELLGVNPDGTVDDLPTEWLLKPLEDIATVERGKFSIRPRNDPRYFGGTTPFIQTGDITGAGDYIVNHSQTLNDMGVGVSRVFAAGTIMTTIAANIGDFSIASYPMACPDSVVGIVPNAGIDTFWLYSTLTCFKSALDRAATQNAQKNINLQTLRPLLIPVPPKELMLELSETLSLGGKALEEAKQGLKNLNSLKSALMSELLSGRVRVPA